LSGHFFENFFNFFKIIINILGHSIAAVYGKRMFSRIQWNLGGLLKEKEKGKENKITVYFLYCGAFGLGCATSFICKRSVAEIFCLVATPLQSSNFLRRIRRDVMKERNKVYVGVLILVITIVLLVLLVLLVWMIKSGFNRMVAC